VLAGLGAWGIYQLRIRQLHQRYDLIVSERSRIARELHDTLIQGFSGITMALQGFSHLVKEPASKEMLDEIITDAATCLRETRQSVAGLRAVQGAGSGLAASIREAAREITETKNIDLKLNVDPDVGPLPADVEYNLMRIASEAIGNAVKHAAARTIGVNLRSGPDGLRLEVTDDGVGLPKQGVAPVSGHYGVIGMKERATQIGAEFQLSNRPKGGTSVSVFLPVNRSVEVTR
jgi:signal transduction histidine kinase